MTVLLECGLGCAAGPLVPALRPASDGCIEASVVESVVFSGPVATAASALEIRLLGEPEVLVAGRPCALPASKKTRALLGYLVATGRPQRRQRLCELFWDGPDDPRAGLRWSLSKLRPLLDVGDIPRLITDREHAGFDARGAVVDVTLLRTLDRAHLTALDPQALERFTALFRGRFLEGLELASCPAFHAWCIAEREVLDRLHVGLLGRLIEGTRGEPARALVHARTLVALDPLAESPRLLVMDLLATLGERRRVIEEYEGYASLLRRELGTDPSFEVERRRMAQSRPAASTSTANPASASATVPSREAGTRGPPAHRASATIPPARNAEPGVPFVGRERECAALAGALAPTSRGAPVLLVFGEPGIGKTRLLEELARLARERGGSVLAGRAFEAELVRPYGVFGEALRSSAEQLEDADRMALGPLLPSLLDGSPRARPASNRSDFYDAVAGLLASVAAARPPLVLVLDDLQWFDEASAELLHFLARRLSAAPLCIAASVRGGELADNLPAQRLVRALGRERLSQTLELGPLEPAELTALLQSAQPGVDLDRVLEEAGGNPLFALEAARALAHGGSDLVGSLARLLSERIERLQEPERALLSWAAALGSGFDAGVLEHVTGLPATELLTSLERLERHALLRAQRSSYDFAHDLLRQAAYRQMSEPRRRLMHAQIARALSAHPQGRGAFAGDVAHHAALGGDTPLAVSATLEAAQRCLRLFAFGDALELSLRGIQLAASLPSEARLTHTVELLGVQVLARPSSDLDAPLARLGNEARGLALAQAAARAAYFRSLLAFGADDTPQAIRETLARVEARRHATPDELGNELAGAARCFLLLQKDLASAARLLDQASEMLGPDEPFDVLWSRGMLAETRGDLDAAADALGRARELARQLPGHWEECECLLQWSLVELDRGQHAAAATLAGELAGVSEKLGESAYGPLAASLMALLAFAPGALAARDTADPRMEGAGVFAGFDASLGGLERAGANRLLSIVLNRAARFALHGGADLRARAYAERALECARRVDRMSELLEARATLAELALRAGAVSAAEPHLAELRTHAAWPDLSARGARAIERLLHGSPAPLHTGDGAGA